MTNRYILNFCKKTKEETDEGSVTTSDGYVNFSVFTKFCKIILTDKEQTDVR